MGSQLSSHNGFVTDDVTEIVVAHRRGFVENIGQNDRKSSLKTNWTYPERNIVLGPSTA